VSRRRRYWTALKETFEWRAIALVLDFLVVWLLTGQLGLAAGFTAVDFVVKTIAFYVWRWAKHGPR
jgi:uncharacterized membrane protein